MRKVSLKTVIIDSLIRFFVIGLFIIALIFFKILSVQFVIQELSIWAQWIILLFIILVIVDYLWYNFG